MWPHAFNVDPSRLTSCRDAYEFLKKTNLSNFTGTAYRNVSRSYVEFQQLYDALTHNNPQTIVPALPLAQTSAPTDEEDDRLVKIMLQRWFTRTCEDMILVYDEELRSFVESDFGYQPTPRPKRKTSSGFSLVRRRVPDEDEELQRARFELTRMEGQFFDAAKALDRVSLTRKCKSSSDTLNGSMFHLAHHESLLFPLLIQLSLVPMQKWATNWSMLPLPKRIHQLQMRCAS